MKQENCIFCKIVTGEIPSATLYESEDFKVILDVEPASKGHALLISKEHYSDLYELPEALAEKAMGLAKKLIMAFTPVLGCDGYNLLQNNRRAAGQTVFHYHLHLIPRYEKDQANLHWNAGSLSEEEKEALQRNLKNVKL